MGVQISGDNITASGTVTVGTLVITGSITYSGLAWLPNTAPAVAINGAAFAYPLAVVMATFAPTEITSLDVNGKSLTSLTGLETLTALTVLDCSSNSLASLDVSGATLLVTLDASDNALTEEEVDAILVVLNVNGVLAGTVDLSGGTNAAPSATGLAAKAALEANGWTVTVTP